MQHVGDPIIGPKVPPELDKLIEQALKVIEDSILSANHELDEETKRVNAVSILHRLTVKRTADEIAKRDALHAGSAVIHMIGQSAGATIVQAFEPDALKGATLSVIEMMVEIVKYEDKVYTEMGARDARH